MPMLIVVVIVLIYNGFLNGHGTAIHEYIYSLQRNIVEMGLEKEPTLAQLELAQLEIVNQLIQEQINIPYEEPNFNLSDERILQNGETVKEMTERNRKLYTGTHDFFVALKNKPFGIKKVWAIKTLEMEIEHFVRSQKASTQSFEDLQVLIDQRKQWLSILKE